MSLVDTTAHINLCNPLNEVSLVGRVPVGALPATCESVSTLKRDAYILNGVESNDRPSE